MESLKIVEPVRPIAPYIGGKRNLSKRLVDRIDAIPHRCYVEAFVGMGGVFFRRRRQPRAEVINDWNRDVATLFRILQRHFTPFVDMLRYQLTSRAEFQRLLATDAKTLTDLERAARFLYLQRTAFGGKVTGQGFGVDPNAGSRLDVTRLVPMLQDVHERLAGVVIECLPYAEMFERYDRPTTLFFLDPPYWGCETDYGDGMFGRGDFARISEILAGIKGRFILTLQDKREVRRVFARFRMERVTTTYTVAGGRNAKRVGELIISGGGNRI